MLHYVMIRCGVSIFTDNDCLALGCSNRHTCLAAIIITSAYFTLSCPSRKYVAIFQETVQKPHEKLHPT